MNNKITREDVEHNTNIRVQVAEGNDVIWSLPTLKKHVDLLSSEVRRIEDMQNMCGEDNVTATILNTIYDDLQSAKEKIIYQIADIDSALDGAKAYIACSRNNFQNSCPCRYYASRNYGTSKVPHVVVLADGSVLRDFDEEEENCVSTELATDPKATEVWAEDIVQPDDCDECGIDPERHDQMHSVTLCDNYVKEYAE